MGQIYEKGAGGEPDYESAALWYRRAAEQVRVDVNHDTWKAFEFTAINGMSNEAAAHELGKSVGSIYAARSRVMKRLSIVVSELEGSYQ